jgi:hypothetical protein
LQLNGKTRAERTTQIATVATCVGLLMRVPFARPGTSTPQRRPALGVIYRQGISRICGARGFGAGPDRY